MIIKKNNPEKIGEISLSSDKAKLIDHMFECLESPSRELTKWEEDFIESTKEQWTKRWWLSDRQLEILERIYAEKTS